MKVGSSWFEYLARLKRGELVPLTDPVKAQQTLQSTSPRASGQSPAPAPITPAPQAPAPQRMRRHVQAPAAGGTPPPSGNSNLGGGGGGQGGGSGGNTPPPPPASPPPPPAAPPTGLQKFRHDNPTAFWWFVIGGGVILGLCVLLAAVLALSEINHWQLERGIQILNKIPPTAAVASPPQESVQASASVPVPAPSRSSGSLQQSCYAPSPGSTTAHTPLPLGRGNCVSVPVGAPRETCLMVRASAPPSEVSGVQDVYSVTPTVENGVQGSEPVAHCNGTCRSFIAANLGTVLCVRQAEGEALSMHF